MDPSNFSEALRSAASRLTVRVAERLPDFVGAVALLLAGWVLALLARAAVRRLLTAALDRFRRRVHPGAKDRFGLDRSLPGFAAGFVFWAVIAVFAVAAADTLGLDGMGELLSGLARQLPPVFSSREFVPRPAECSLAIRHRRPYFPTRVMWGNQAPGCSTLHTR